jgi:hypothetical protein
MGTSGVVLFILNFATKLKYVPSFMVPAALLPGSTQYPLHMRGWMQYKACLEAAAQAVLPGIELRPPSP